MLQKRKLIRLLVPIFQQRGTIPGVVNTIRFFTGITVTVSTYDGVTMALGESQLGVDWILGPGTSFALYAFQIESPVSLTAEQIAIMTFVDSCT